jgi:hypothetical protein
MVEIKSGEKMDKAIQRAKDANLLVQVADFREYKVTNRETGAVYEVNFYVSAGRKFGDCQCRAGQCGQLCKHVAAALGWHVVRAAEIAASSSPALSIENAPMIRPAQTQPQQKWRGIAI